MSEPILYRICWSENGFRGNGEMTLSWELAQSWLTYLKKKHPDIQHWLEHN